VLVLWQKADWRLALRSDYPGQEKLEHAFAWMPVCDMCAEKAFKTLSGPAVD
jgi:hypothetical protein